MALQNASRFALRLRSHWMTVSCELDDRFQISTSPLLLLYFVSNSIQYSPFRSVSCETTATRIQRPSELNVIVLPMHVSSQPQVSLRAKRMALRSMEQSERDWNFKSLVVCTLLNRAAIRIWLMTRLEFLLSVFITHAVQMHKWFLCMDSNPSWIGDFSCFWFTPAVLNVISTWTFLKSISELPQFYLGSFFCGIFRASGKFFEITTCGESFPGRLFFLLFELWSTDKAVLLKGYFRWAALVSHQDETGELRSTTKLVFDRLPVALSHPNAWRL